MTQSVELEPSEWQQVITALAMSNPVLVKISTQLAASANAQQQQDAAERARQVPTHSGNSSMKEPHHGL